MADDVTPGSSSTSFKKESDFKPLTTKTDKPKTLDEIRAGSGKRQRTVVTKQKKQGSSWGSFLVALLVALLIRTFFVEAFRIPTGSMKNTLLVGDYLFVNKVSYYLRSPKYVPFTSWEIPYFSIKTGSIDRGDVIVFEYPGDRDLVTPREKKVNYIKRCIGIPGDDIQIKNKQVFVNGVAMKNPEGMRYRDHALAPNEIDPMIFPKGAPWNKDWFGPIHIPKKGERITITPENLEQWEVFIAREGSQVKLGDNGQIFIDGQQQNTYVIKRDYLWMMGDNRDDSEDSRFWGFAPVDNVVGSGLIIYWSWYNPPKDSYGDGYDPEEVQKFQIRWNRIGKLIH